MHIIAFVNVMKDHIAQSNAKSLDENVEVVNLVSKPNGKDRCERKNWRNILTTTQSSHFGGFQNKSYPKAFKSIDKHHCSPVIDR